MTASGLHFTAAHPLAVVARQHCLHEEPVLGGVACGPCWERAIRDDEQFAIECGLPRDLEVDPSAVDEVAIERACAGERLPLTDHELAVAIRRLRRSGFSLTAIARRLRAGERVVARETSGIPAGPRAARGQRRGGVAA